MARRDYAAIIIFAFCYALSIVAVKTAVVLFLAAELSWPGLILSAIHDFVFGFALYALIVYSNNLHIRYVILALILCVLIAIEFIAFHYQMVFGRLPGASILFYLSELEQLETSLGNNLPLLLFVVEVILALVLTCLLYVYLKENFLHLFRRWLSGSIALLLVVISISLQFFPSILPLEQKWVAQHEITWLVRSAFVGEQGRGGQVDITSVDIDNYLSSMGHGKNSRSTIQDYPLCENSPRQRVKQRRSVILLILEGVSVNEMHAVKNGRALMPNLVRISNENISFKNIYAPGAKSAQALTAIFSGLPAHTNYHYLWTKPLINLGGFPSILKDQDYVTGYFHGSDLSFEQQRTYLKAAGFSHIYEYGQEKEHEVYGWGYDDAVMFNELKKWIADVSHKSIDAQYFSSLFTVSSHDPYLLPGNWEPVFSKENFNKKSSTSWTTLTALNDVKLAALDSYLFLDAQLGKFYDWYVESEKAKGTILIITGDHGSYLLNEKQNKTENMTGFNVPLIFSGNELEVVSNTVQELEQRVGGLHDLPATVMSLLGGSSHDCNLGLNLFSASNEWPQQRLVYSVAGDALENLYLWKRDEQFMLDRDAERLYSFKNEGLKEVDLNTAPETILRTFSELTNVFKVNYHLLRNNRYFPGAERNKMMTALPAVTNPVIISHRGNIDGQGDPRYENSKQALDEVVASGFDWVEIDVQLTADGVPVLLHDPFVIIEDGSKLNVISTTYKQLKNIEGNNGLLTLEQALEQFSTSLNILVEVKAPEHISDILHLGREVSRLIREYQGNKNIIVDSFHDELITSIKKQCQCETGLDTPYKVMLNKEALEYIKSMNMDWVYLHFSVVTPEIIRMAHDSGLKVMAYTVNSPDIIHQWLASELPDAIITDDIAIKSLLESNLSTR